MLFQRLRKISHTSDLMKHVKIKTYCQIPQISQICQSNLTLYGIPTNNVYAGNLISEQIQVSMA